jgi:hypothetical protein
MKLYFSDITRFACILVCITVLSGCHFTLEREVDLTLAEDTKISGSYRTGQPIDDLSDREVIEEIILQGWKQGLVTLPLGQNCDFSESVRELEESVKDPVDLLDSPFAALLRLFFVRGELSGLVLKDITCAPSLGNFDSISRYSLRVHDTTQGTINTYSATGPFQDAIVLTPERNIDLYHVIRNAEIECLDTELVLQGTQPANDILFDITRKAAFEVKLRFFSF